MHGSYMFGFELCDFASFLQFEHAFVEKYTKIQCNNDYYNVDSNCATSQAALNMLVKLGPLHLTKYNVFTNFPRRLPILSSTELSSTEVLSPGPGGHAYTRPHQ